MSVRASRREFLRAVTAAAISAACEQVGPAAQPTTRPPTSPPTPSETPDAKGAPAEQGGPSLVILAGALADGRAASTQRRVAVLVRAGRFVYVGPSDGLAEAAGAQVVEAPGLTVVPAMVDCHAHLTGTGGPDYVARIQDGDAVLLARAEENARTLVRAGVLAARDVGAVRGVNVRARDALKGQAEAPLIVAAGTWIGRRGRYVSFAVQVDGADQLRAAALAQLDAGADLVKIAADGATGSAASFSAAELRPVVEAVHARGKKVAAHCQGLGSRVAAEAGVDSVEHGYVIDATTARTMRGRTALVSTLSVPVAFGNRSELEMGFASVRAARDAGVRIATGTDFGGAPPRPGNFADEVELLVRAGLAPHEALGSATWIAGEVLGIAHLGTIAVGAPADLVLIDGDPLSDPAALRRVRAVYRAGARVV